MDTIMIRMDEDDIKEEELARAAAVLRRGGLVAFPTETVYGLGGDALNRGAAEKIYAAKGRPSDNPLIVHIAKREDLEELASVIPKKAEQLADRFWPGPLTMIFQKSGKVPFGTTGGLDTVAVRMPLNKIALALIKESGVYIAAPSANTSGRPSPTTADHVAEDLNGRIDMIIDGGPVGLGLESTIVDMTEEIPLILRPGFITREMLEEVIGEIAADEVIMQGEDARPRAPGMKYKHYAPKALLYVVEGAPAKVAQKINRLIQEDRKAGKRVGVIATRETRELYEDADVKSIGTRQNEGSIARGLYAVLREFDKDNAEVIYSESFGSDGLGQAIMNRLLKAAGQKTIDAGYGGGYDDKI